MQVILEQVQLLDVSTLAVIGLAALLAFCVVKLANRKKFGVLRAAGMICTPIIVGVAPELFSEGVRALNTIITGGYAGDPYQLDVVNGMLWFGVAGGAFLLLEALFVAALLADSKREAKRRAP